MHARIEAAALFIDTDDGHAQRQRAVDEVHNALRFLYHARHPAFTDPAGVARLTAALRVKQGSAQHYGEFVLVGCAVEDFDIRLEVVTVKKQAKRHIPCPDRSSVFII